MLSGTHSTPWHNLLQKAAARMARRASFQVRNDSRQPRDVSMPYSPNWCPDFTCLHGSDAGAHIIADVTCTSVVKATTLGGAARRPSHSAVAAEVQKRALYGDRRPHTVLPFVVEHAGALGPDAMKFFKRCRKAVCNELSDGDDSFATWSSLGFSNHYLQAFSVANLQGLGHYISTAAGIIRARR